MTEISRVIESKHFIQNLYKTYQLYFRFGSRSSQKVNCFHKFIKINLEKIFTKEKDYKVLMEQNVPSFNSSGKKRCDIVVYHSNEPYIVFTVKLIMTNYKQNKNNGWENLTGEIMHLLWSNPNLKIIPINIFIDKLPYLKKDKTITRFEKVNYEDIKNYEILKEKRLVFDNINYILNVEHENNIDEEYDTLPKILKFDNATKYRTFYEILKDLV